MKQKNQQTKTVCQQEWIHIINNNKQKLYSSLCYRIEIYNKTIEQIPTALLVCYNQRESLINYKQFKGSLDPQKWFNCIANMHDQAMLQMKKIKKVQVEENSSELTIYFSSTSPELKFKFKELYLAKIWKLLIQRILVDEEYHRIVKQVLPKLQQIRDADLSSSLSDILTGYCKDQYQTFIKETKQFGSEQKRDKTLHMIRQLQDQPLQLAKYVLSKTFALDLYSKNSSPSVSKLSEYTNKQRQFTDRIELLQNETTLLKQRLEQKNQSNRALERQFSQQQSKLQKTIEQIARKYETQRQKLAVSQLKIKSWNEQKQTYQSLIKTSSIKVNEYELLLQQNKSLLHKVNHLDQQMYLHIFQGQTLHDYKKKKEFLKQSIEAFIGKSICYTKMLYSFDLTNPNNYHQYFDQHPNICVVIRLKNQQLLAGFSISPFSSKNVASQGGILCSLTSQKVFKLIQGKRSVTYDNYFLIFGNSELRIKQSDNKFFTNFGIANSFFDSQNQKYTVLTGEGGARQEIISHYEIFQVIFRT